MQHGYKSEFAGKKFYVRNKNESRTIVMTTHFLRVISQSSNIGYQKRNKFNKFFSHYYYTHTHTHTYTHSKKKKQVPVMAEYECLH